MMCQPWRYCSPPVKDQSKLWKQPQPQSRSPAPESCQPRQWLKLSLPANMHRPAMELTINFLRRSPSAVKKKSHKILRRIIQAGIDANQHELAQLNGQQGGREKAQKTLKSRTDI